MAKKKKQGRATSKATVEKHVERLKMVAAKHGGVLPSYTWLEDHGLFGSYDVVRAAGKLGQFKRVAENEPAPKKKARKRKAAKKTRRPNPAVVREEGAADLLGVNAE